MVPAKREQPDIGSTVNKVCIIRRKHFPFNKNLRRNAETLAREGYEVDVICLKRREEKRFEKWHGVNVHRIALEHHRGRVFWYLFDYAAFFILAAATLTLRHLRNRYDVVEVSSMPDFLVFVTLLPKLLGRKVVLFLYENMPTLFMSSFSVGPDHIGTRLLRLIEKLSAGYADRVIVSDGELNKEILVRRGIRPEKIEVVLNVPDDVIFSPERFDSCGGNSHFRLAVVSTVVRRYGIQTLIKAAGSLVPEIPHLEVEVIGDGEYLPELKTMADRAGLGERCHFTGWILGDEVPEHLARADVCVAPMLDDVGAPNKVFEYFALAKPTVASTLPGLTAMFNGGCIAYFEPGNERELAARILELYKNPEKRVSMGSGGRAVYRECWWPVMKRRYLKVYRELTNGT